MSDEKMMVLKMLEDGLINASEAKDLLEAMEGPTHSDDRYKQKSDAPPKEGANFQEFANGLGSKLESLKRDFEPRLQKFTETVVEKTATVADKFSKPFLAEEILTKNKNNHKNALSSTFQLGVTERDNKINLSSINDVIYVSGYEGKKVTVKAIYKPKIRNAKIDFIKREQEYSLDYNEDEFDFVSVEAFVPKSLFRSINIQCINSTAEVFSIDVENIAVSNLNGNIKLQNIQADAIKVDTNNGSLNATDITSKSGKFEVSCGNIYCINFDIEDLYIQGFEGATSINIAEFNKFKEYMHNIDTKNGKLTMHLPRTSNVGYHIKAQASLSMVKVGLASLDYIVDSNDYVEAKSINYDACLKHVTINARTYNSLLNIR